jgi:hypothetical protein
MGGGTLGRLTKWTGFTSSNSFIGDSTIFENKNGLVGIGTDTPTSKLTVAGTIESGSGGFKFPDGTVQISSAAGALFSVEHDATLTGNGTAAMPLSVVQSDPADQPFQIFLHCVSGAQPPCSSLSFTVPAGKRLTIEYIGGAYSVPTNASLPTLASMTIQTQIGSDTTSHTVLSHRSQNDPPPGFTGYLVGQPVRFYADPGTQVSAGGFPINAGTIIVNLSGHFVNVP